MKKSVLGLFIVIIILAGISSSVGVFYTDGGEKFTVESVRGEEVEIFGDGIYAHESSFKAPIDKGTDTVVLFLVVPLLILTVIFYRRSLKIRVLNVGLLGSLLYYAASVAFGVAFNKIFIVYLLLFSACLFGVIISLKEIGEITITDKAPRRGLIIFMILAGCSVFVWFKEILGILINGTYPGIIGISTTEPTFILDIGIIAPVAFYSAYLIYKKSNKGFLLGSILLTLNAIVGVMVAVQSIFQYSYGVYISIAQFIPYVSLFLVMSIFALGLNMKLIKNIKV